MSDSPRSSIHYDCFNIFLLVSRSVGLVWPRPRDLVWRRSRRRRAAGVQSAGEARGVQSAAALPGGPSSSQVGQPDNQRLQMRSIAIIDLFSHSPFSQTYCIGPHLLCLWGLAILAIFLALMILCLSTGLKICTTEICRDVGFLPNSGRFPVVWVSDNRSWL